MEQLEVVVPVAQTPYLVAASVGIQVLPSKLALLYKMLDFTRKMLHQLKNMLILKIKILDTDPQWKTVSFL